MIYPRRIQTVAITIIVVLLLVAQDSQFSRIAKGAKEGQIQVKFLGWYRTNARIHKASVGDEIEAKVMVKAVNGPVKKNVRVVLFEQYALWFPKTIAYREESLDLLEGESVMILVDFIPGDATDDGILLFRVRGYYVALQDFWLLGFANEPWRLEESYPPRLEVESSI